MRSRPDISIVVPVHDEADGLEELAIELARAAERLPGSCELIFVDDGSTDGSRELLAAIARRDGRVRVLLLDGHHGQSAALAAGFAAARGEITATLDADLQNDPADLPALVERLLASGADIVNGVRTARNDPWSRRLASRVANAVRSRVTHDRVTDVGCSLRVMRTRWLRRIRPFSGMHRFLPVLLEMEGARVIECPVGHRPRRHGTSHYGILDRLRVAAVDLLALRWMQSRALRYRVTELRAPGDARSPGVVADAAGGKAHARAGLEGSAESARSA